MKTIIVGIMGRWGNGIYHLVRKFSEIIAVDQNESVYKLTSDEKVIKCVTSLKDLGGLQSDMMIIAIPGQYFRKFLETNISFLKVYSEPVALQMKALELETGKRLTEIWDEVIETNKRVVIVGPVHSEYLINEKPVSMVISSEIENENIVKIMLRKYKHSSLKLRPQYDVVGVEIGAAAKNPIGIMSGILFTLGYESLIGELITRASFEVGRVVSLKGGCSKTVYGLSHLGDYAATVFSPLSHNRQYGEFLARRFKTGEEIEWTGGLVEGIDTIKAFWSLVSDNESVEDSTISNSIFPLFRAIYGVLFQNYNIKEAIQKLRNRSSKEEFWGIKI